MFHLKCWRARYSSPLLKTGGITQGPIEMKHLRSLIRAKGTLTVPNQNKALITSLSSGVYEDSYEH